MNKVKTIKVKKISEAKELGNTSLTLKLSGDDINYVILNSLRRVAMSNIPIYAFTKFKFNKNTSVFNNNYLKLYISNIPIWNIKNDLEKVPEKKIIETKEVEFSESTGLVLDTDENDKLDSTSLNNLTMFVNYKNKTSDNFMVTTDDAQFYYNENKIKSPFPMKIPIVTLQKDQEINFSAITGVSTEEEDAIFSPVTIFTWKEHNDHEFDLKLESRGQLTEKRILKLSCKLVISILQEFFQKLPNNSGLEGDIVVPNQDHTLGNLLSTGITSHSKAEYATYHIKHPLKKEIVIKYKLNGSNLKTIVGDVITYYNKVFGEISKLI